MKKPTKPLPSILPELVAIPFHSNGFAAGPSWLRAKKRRRRPSPAVLRHDCW